MKIAFAVFAGVLVTVGVIFGIVGALTHPSLGGGTATRFDNRDVIDACEDSIKASLKDPDSARFDNWTASAGTNGSQYFASGMVNAKNGFGGYVGDQPYSCDATVSGDNVSATAHPS